MEKRMCRRRILYIQHATAFGGSVVSLLYLIQGLDQNIYEPIVLCLRHSDVIDFYRSYGIKTINGIGMGEFCHTTGGWYPLYSPLGLWQLTHRLAHFWPSVRHTQAMVAQLSPDLVHLNSLVLAPSAVGVKQAGVPLVWQVRESVVAGHFGLRRRLLGWLVERLADEAIFISEDGRRRLVGGRKGIVIPNFVDFRRFDRDLPGDPVRAELGIRPEARVVLFLGGRSIIKGIFPLLDALCLAKRQMPSLECVIAAGRYHFSGRLVSRIARTVLPLVGSGTVAQRVDRILEQYQMYDYVHLLDFRPDVERLIAASDLVVFPSIEPHFSRPVIEAGAMAKPVVASCIGGVEELVDHSETGLLVPPGNSGALAQAMVTLLQDEQMAMYLGEQGYQKARRQFDARTNVQRVVEVYECLLKRTESSCIATRIMHV